MVDYSKWKNIEISDDEDDTHPNIDTASLFRWRHQARVERMAEEQKAKEDFNLKKKETETKLLEVRQKLKEAKDIDLTPLKSELAKLEKEEKEIKKIELDISKKEKLTPWNVDTISKEGFTKTIINKAPKRKGNEGLTEEEKMEKQRQFVKEKEQLLKQYGLLRKFDDSKRFLQEHPELTCEETANYLVIWCINLQVEEKNDLMEHVAHQCICMQYILELSKQMDVDPRACVSAFFTRIQTADIQYKEAFNDELEMFKERIKVRAQKRIEEAVKEIEEEEREKRLGPGGLDPAEVFESLPDALKECFEKQDIAMLQKVITEFPEDEIRQHMKRCVDSGLWIPDAKAANLMEEPAEPEGAAGEPKN